MNIMANHIFLELLQAAVGKRRCLSKVLTEEEWIQVYGLFKKHALLGIGYVAIQKLPKEQWPQDDDSAMGGYFATDKATELGVERGM